MSLIEDPILAAIMDGRSYGGLPRATAYAIFKIVNLLRCARSMDDVSIFRACVHQAENRFLVPADGKWAVSFQFLEGHGPTGVKLEKLGKQWPKKTKSRSRPKRRAKS